MTLIAFARRTRNASRLLFESAKVAVRDDWLGQYWPSKPVVIQFPVNDICNARCTMCNIWQKKRDKELTPDELRRILKDSLFSSVRYVGMSGGEPTLRRDLPELGRALIDCLPQLKGFGIITNAVQAENVIDRTVQLANVARASNVAFSAMISLDGIGADHDKNRGKDGNYESAMRVYEEFRKQNVPVGIGCTLTPTNCYGADDVLLWCESNDVPFWEFRLGVEIKRVYNDGYAHSTPFSQEQRFHLIMFFEKLAEHPKVGLIHQMFYRSLVGQLAFGHRRVAGCDWRGRGVTLDTRGNISYCSVQSPILESALDESAWSIYRRNLPIRRDILKTKCGDCQHDLLGTPPFRVALGGLIQTITAPFSQRITRATSRISGTNVPTKIHSPNRESPSKWRHVLITGWYGTETAGDKAILSEVVSFIKSRSPDCRITITTLNRKVSEQTNREVEGLELAGLVPLSEAAKPSLIDSCDAVVFGGGPLEEIPTLDRMLRIFAEANRRRKARIIFGCGVGPLRTKRLRDIVGGLLRLTTAGFLRDRESWEFAQKLGGSASLGCACDPAIGFLSRLAPSQPDVDQVDAQPTLASLLRANTHEYVDDLSSAELSNANSDLARRMAEVLESASARLKAKVCLLPMHSLPVGGDDRIFNRSVAQAFRATDAPGLNRDYLTLNQLLSQIRSADLAVAMRYHGHLFCLALGIPFLSIDYTGQNGKVSSLLKRIGYTQWSQDWRTPDERRAADKLAELFAGRQYWSDYLRAQARELSNELAQTYASVFPK
jgi:polysaccharide pyruvyl transferase WcaK-like protein/MoaA/NifB/PqqE/SkfB family radical SAM enzyme